jgi:MraZ protein
LLREERPRNDITGTAGAPTTRASPYLIIELRGFFYGSEYFGGNPRKNIVVIYAHASFRNAQKIVRVCHHFFSCLKIPCAPILVAITSPGPQYILGDITLFLGRHPAQLKTPTRLPIPAHWHELILNGGAYLTQGFDQNLMILPSEVFQTIYERITAVNIADPLARLLMRAFLSTATYVEQMENDSITLPSNLSGYANLEDRVVIVGQGEYVEVWSSDLWQQQELELQNSQANAQRFSAFTITLTQN